MREDKSERIPERPWRVPVAVEDVPEEGQAFALAADAEVRAAIAKIAGLRDLPQFAANFDVTRQGDGGLRVVGRVSAVAGQTCVVTLEPLLNAIEEDVDLFFMPRAAPPSVVAENDAKPAASEAKWNDPEPLLNGVVDLGTLATEFLILGLDPYPRKPGAVFEQPPEHASEGGPFAALAGWSKGGDRR
jgi:hypothetical protein